MPNSEIWAIEIKHGSAPKLNPAYNRAFEDVSATHKFIVYGGDDTIHAGNDTTMLSIKSFLKDSSKDK